MARKKVVLMNHTDMQGHHFGCARVMRLLEDGLTSRGAIIRARLDGKMDWRKSPTALDALSECDSIVINGEGTLHHGRKKASWLMDVAQHPVTQGKELALVNALFQKNPDSWIGLVSKFEHLYARDSRSAAELSRMANREVSFFGDLSTSSGSIGGSKSREGIIVGDSVKNEITGTLYHLALELDKSEKTQIIPLTISLREENPYKSKLQRAVKRRIYARRQQRQQLKYPILKYLKCENEYVHEIQNARLSVTGRFHGICLNLVTGTPFACVASNSWKIEALFEDAGLDKRRLLKRRDLNVPNILENDWAFSATELKNISSFLERSQTSSEKMFDAITGELPDKVS